MSTPVPRAVTSRPPATTVITRSTTTTHSAVAGQSRTGLAHGGECRGRSIAGTIAEPGPAVALSALVDRAGHRRPIQAAPSRNDGEFPGVAMDAAA